MNGHENPPGNRFCGVCGAEVAESAPQTHDATSSPEEPGTSASDGVVSGETDTTTSGTPGPPNIKQWLAVQRNRYVAAGIAGAIVLAVVLIIVLGGGGSSSHTITGHLNLTDADTAAADCDGQGGFSDISEGATITVTDQSGTVIGSGQIGKGKSTADILCIYPFRITDVTDDAKFYHFKISHRDGPSDSHATMQKQGWKEELTLS